MKAMISFLLGFFLVGALPAIPLSFEFNGTVSGYTGSDGAFVPGQSFTVTIAYDPELFTDAEADPTFGRYSNFYSGNPGGPNYNNPASITFVYGGTTFSSLSGAGTMNGLNCFDTGQDRFAIMSEGNGSSIFHFQLTDEDGDALADDTLPQNIDPSLWTSGTFSYRSPTGRTMTAGITGLGIDADAGTLRVANDVPDQGASILLFGLAMVGIFAIQHGAKRT